MYEVGKYVAVMDADDWAKHYDKSFKRFNHASVPSDIDLTHFPIFLKYTEPWDYHFCGSYSVVSK